MQLPKTKKIKLIKHLLFLFLIFVIFKLLFTFDFKAINNSLYKYSGVLPIAKDKNNTYWVYFGVEYQINNPKLAILAGKKEPEDNNALDIALRELREESLDVFEQYINNNTIKINNQNLQIDYNIFFLLSTKIYLALIDRVIDTNDCDEFIAEYNTRRYLKPKKYEHLSLPQRETYELRKVRLKELIKYLNNPDKYHNKISSYGGKSCLPDQKIPIRWSSRILLQQQEKLIKLDKH